MRLGHHPRRRGLAGEGERPGGGRALPRGGGRNAAGDCTEPDDSVEFWSPRRRLRFKWGGVKGATAHSPQPGPSIFPRAGRVVVKVTGRTLMIPDVPCGCPVSGEVGGSCPNFPPPSLFLNAGVGKFRETEPKPKDPSTLIFKLGVGALPKHPPAGGGGGLKEVEQGLTIAETCEPFPNT